MFGQIGVPGIILIFLIILLLFGAKNLPNIGKSLGESLNEFKNAFNTNKNDLDRDENTNIHEKEKKTIVQTERIEE